MCNVFDAGVMQPSDLVLLILKTLARSKLFVWMAEFISRAVGDSVGAERRREVAISCCANVLGEAVLDLVKGQALSQETESGMFSLLFKVIQAVSGTAIW